MASPSSPSVNERRGRRLAPIRTNFSRPTTPLPDGTRNNTATTTATATTTIFGSRRPWLVSQVNTQVDQEKSPNPHPPQTERTKRQHSKPGLRSLFGLGRSLRKTKKERYPIQVDEIPTRPRPTTTAATTTSSQVTDVDVRADVDADVPLPSPSLCATPRTTVSGSTLTSPNGVGPGTITTTAAAAAARPSSKNPCKSRGRPRSVKSTANGNGNGSGNGTAWKPPPLFQAYPQAIKHCCLPLPVPASLLAESILRINGAGIRRTAKDARNHSSTSTSSNGRRPDGDSADPTSTSVSPRKRREARKDNRLYSSSNTSTSTTTPTSMDRTEWTKKIYVLATAGYLLQYSVEGKFDRLPEKMMKLGPKSVAFASDAIPGKPWVLQVSQHYDEESCCRGTTATTATTTTATASSTTAADGGGRPPRLSRFNFYRSRWTRTLLLVFDSADEMHSWLVTVRTEIELRGGQKYETEMPPKRDDDASHRPFPNQPPNPRRPIQRDLDLDLDLGQLLSDTTTTSSSNNTRRRSQRWENESATDYQSRRTSYTESANRRSVSVMSHPDDVSSTSHSQFDGNASNQAGQSKHHHPVNRYSQETTGRCATPPTPNFSVPSFSKKKIVVTGTTGSSSGRQTPTSQPSSRSTTPLATAAGKVSQLPVSSRQGHRHLSHADSMMDITTSSDMDYSSAISAFPTPPQSPTPTQGLSSPVRKDSSDKLSIVSHDSSVKRQLAISTSQDSLAEVIQRSVTPNNGTVESKTNRSLLTRLPRAAASASPVSTQQFNMVLSPPSTPGGSSRSIRGGASQRDRIPSSSTGSRTDTSSPSGSSSSTSAGGATTTTTSSSSSSLYRKSPSGLSVGPPTAPPPTCPLPKIPSLAGPNPETFSPSGSSSTSTSTVFFPDRPPSSASVRLCKSPSPRSVQGSRKRSVGSMTFDRNGTLSAREFCIWNPSVQGVSIVSEV